MLGGKLDARNCNAKTDKNNLLTLPTVLLIALPVRSTIGISCDMVTGLRSKPSKVFFFCHVSNSTCWRFWNIICCIFIRHMMNSWPNVFYGFMKLLQLFLRCRSNRLHWCGCCGCPSFFGGRTCEIDVWNLCRRYLRLNKNNLGHNKNLFFLI